jgi:hypothetical protein
MNSKDIEARIARLGELSDGLGKERSLWRSSSKHWISDYLAGILTAQHGLADAKLALVKARERLARAGGGR